MCVCVLSFLRSAFCRCALPAAPVAGSPSPSRCPPSRVAVVCLIFLSIVLPSCFATLPDLVMRRNDVRKAQQQSLYPLMFIPLKYLNAKKKTKKQQAEIDALVKAGNTFHLPELDVRMLESLTPPAQWTLPGPGQPKSADFRINGFTYLTDKQTGCVKQVYGDVKPIKQERPDDYFNTPSMVQYLQHCSSDLKAATAPLPGFNFKAKLGRQKPWVNCRSLDKGELLLLLLLHTWTAFNAQLLILPRSLARSIYVRVGHIVAHQLGGSSYDPINVFPQWAESNQNGRWWAMEMAIGSWLLTQEKPTSTALPRCEMVHIVIDFDDCTRAPANEDPQNPSQFKYAQPGGTYSLYIPPDCWNKIQATQTVLPPGKRSTYYNRLFGKHAAGFPALLASLQPPLSQADSAGSLPTPGRAVVSQPRGPTWIVFNDKPNAYFLKLQTAWTNNEADTPTVDPNAQPAAPDTPATLAVQVMRAPVLILVGCQSTFSRRSSLSIDFRSLQSLSFSLSTAACSCIPFCLFKQWSVPALKGPDEVCLSTGYSYQPLVQFLINAVTDGDNSKLDKVIAKFADDDAASIAEARKLHNPAHCDPGLRGWTYTLESAAQPVLLNIGVDSPISLGLNIDFVHIVQLTRVVRTLSRTGLRLSSAFSLVRASAACLTHILFRVMRAQVCLLGICSFVYHE